MRKLTTEEAGKIIAHWRREPNEMDRAAVRSIVTEALNKAGVDCTAEFSAYAHVPTLGHGGITAVIRLNKPYAAIRTVAGSLIKGLDTITIRFDRCAGLMDYEAAMARHKEEDAILESAKSVADARAAIDNLEWDGEVVQFTSSTNGRIRDYRCRHFYPYEGRGHFGYAPDWETLGECLAKHIKAIARETGYERRKTYESIAA